MSNLNSSGRGLDRAWSWMRVYYFEARKDDLILDGIWPNLDAGCPIHRQRVAFYQRDWSGGSNILVGLKRCCTGDNVAAVAGRIEEYLGAHPSTTLTTEQEYAERSRQLSQMENCEALPLQSNNSVVFTDEPVLALLKDENAKVDVREYMAQSSSICIEWLKNVRHGSVNRNHLALQLLVAMVWVVNPESFSPYLSLRSHAEGYLQLAARRGTELRVRFQACYDAERGAAVRLAVEQTLRSLESGEELTAGMNAMLDLLRRTLTTLYNGVATSQYKLESMLKNSLDDSPAFRSWQMTVSLVYRTLNQLGITAAERFLICYLVSRALEDRCGHDRNPFWDWEKGPIDLKVCNREDVERAFPYFYQGAAI